MEGLQKYSTNEAQNITLGQAGVAFLSGTGTYTPPDGQVVVAIQFMEDTRFDSSDATTADANWPTDAQGGAGSGGQAINQSVMLAGTTIYGRWKTVAFDAGKAFLYLG
tara:strand:+ start:2597 stop:2920 length:324 start_codon:yes stop_codon:yes gene_type:complete